MITDRVRELNRHFEVLRPVEHHEGEHSDGPTVPGPFTTWPADGLSYLPKICVQLPDGTLKEAPSPTTDENDDDDEFGWSNPADWVLPPDRTYPRVRRRAITRSRTISRSQKYCELDCSRSWPPGSTRRRFVRHRYSSKLPCVPVSAHARRARRI